MLLDGAAIVLSILVAFGIDAWWDQLQDSRAERDLLRSLHAEFSDNLSTLDELSGWHTDFADAATRLLEYSETGSVPANPLTLDTLVRLTFINSGSYNPSQGVLTALIASGDLGLISDPDLREKLGSWSGALEEITEDELWVFRDNQERWIPALQERVPLYYTYLASPLWSSDYESRRPRPSYERVLGDPLMENFMLSRIDSELFVVAGMAELRALIVEILSLIESNLD